MEIRPIDANAAIQEIKDIYCKECNTYNGVRCRACDFDDAMSVIDDAPTLDYAPVVHGEWIKETGMAPPEFQGKHKCSLCFHYALSWKIGREELSPFCPNCGARMDGKEDEHG